MTFRSSKFSTICLNVKYTFKGLTWNLFKFAIFEINMYSQRSELNIINELVII